MIQIAHRSWTHAGDKPGRFQVLDLRRPRVVGVLSNTPWPIAGEHMPSRMLDTARTLSNQPFPDPAAACAALLQRLRASLKPFSGAAAWGNEDDWEASWDFGGDGAFAAEVGTERALARVGNLRVVSLTAEGIVGIVLPEHTLQGPEPIITASLGNQDLPPDAVWTGDLQGASWVLLGTPAVLELLDGDQASRHLQARAFSEAANSVFADIHDARSRLDSPASSALMIVELASEAPAATGAW